MGLLLFKIGNCSFPAFILLILISISGCTPGANEQSYHINEYYDVVGLIKEEARYFESNPPQSIHKTVQMAGNSETQEKAVDSLKDIKSIIATADINKPALRGVYATDTAIKVQGTDTIYSTITHDLKPEEDELVRLIKVYFQGAPHKANLCQVLIHKKRSNLLYRNAQYIYMDFGEKHLSSLILEGTQQILHFATHGFRTEFQIMQDS